MILPAVTLAFAMSAKYTRQVRTAIVEELSQDYVIGARARGVKRMENPLAQCISQLPAAAAYHVRSVHG